jgi:hypothetical protein
MQIHENLLQKLASFRYRRDPADNVTGWCRTGKEEACLCDLD